jgi:N-acetylmuramic acid 6-phosphate etherase
MRETERRNPATVGLGRLDTAGVVDSLLAAHQDVPAIVARAAPETVAAVEGALERLRDGGRLVYVASGTPGWLADADAAELPPTFGFDRLAVVRAGRDGEEDAPERGGERIAALELTPSDVVVAVAASGSPPFTLGAAERAARDGAFVIAVVNNPHAAIAATVTVELRTGAEPIMGSTRMRAGLAQRLWLTVFSTALMVRLGRTHDNLMVNVAPTLAKLRERRIAILAEATGLDAASAAAALARAGDDLRAAIDAHS